jgi:hypothetical protein
MRLVRAAVRRGLEGHEQDLQQAVHAAVTRIIDALGNGLVLGDVGTERAQAILAQLEEKGLLVPKARVTELAEEMATERLAALKQEHGLVGV